MGCESTVNARAERCEKSSHSAKLVAVATARAMRYAIAIFLLAATAQSLALTRLVPTARPCVVHTVRHRRVALEEPEIADGAASDGVGAAPTEPTPSPFNNLPAEPTPTPEPETLPQALQRIFVSEFGLQVAGVTLLFGAWIYLSSTMMTSDFWQSGLFE